MAPFATSRPPTRSFRKTCVPTVRTANVSKVVTSPSGQAGFFRGQRLLHHKTFDEDESDGRDKFGDVSFFELLLWFCALASLLHVPYYADAELVGNVLLAIDPDDRP
ncbi:hypothetical protein PG997_009080 [Apiospora hydei]|uniref:Uncharacterized protein n=1 Tax=Apiospora hydei TaxID=1337664 RepID=A0ABR1VT76_9PEZI